MTRIDEIAEMLTDLKMEFDDVSDVDTDELKKIKEVLLDLQARIQRKINDRKT